MNNTVASFWTKIRTNHNESMFTNLQRQEPNDSVKQDRHFTNLFIGKSSGMRGQRTRALCFSRTLLRRLPSPEPIPAVHRGLCRGGQIFRLRQPCEQFSSPKSLSGQNQNFKNNPSETQKRKEIKSLSCSNRKNFGFFFLRIPSFAYNALPQQLELRDRHILKSKKIAQKAELLFYT